MPVGEVLDCGKATGITLTYSTETEKLVDKPTSAVTLMDGLVNATEPTVPIAVEGTVTTVWTKD